MEIHAFKRKDILLHAEEVRSEHDFTFNLDGSTLYWTDQTTGELISIDLWSDRRTLNVGEPGNKLSAMTRSTDGRLGFISNLDRNQMIVVDLSAMQVLAEIPVGSAPGRPWGTTDLSLIHI